MTLAQSLRGVLRRDLLAISAVVFCADLVSGVFSPTFALYARSLGASLTLVGVLTSVVGLTQFLSAVPIGIQSDRVGRKPMITLGLLCFAGATTAFALAPNAWALLPGRVLYGLAGVATFYIGSAYVGDVARPEERGVAFGFYTTAMGLGFAIGPLIGSLLAAAYGIPGSYLGAAVVALCGAAIAHLGLRQTRATPGGVQMRRTRPSWAEMRQLIRDPNLSAASIANLVTSVAYNGAILNFFPLYAAQLGAGQTEINSMFSSRAFASTAARIPSGLLAVRLTTWFMILVAPATTAFVLLGMSNTTALAALGVLLILEGIAFGAFLTTGQAFVAEHSVPRTRGAAVGIYSTANSIGSTFSPLLMGIAADLFGVAIVFRLTAALSIVAMLYIGRLYLRRRQLTVDD